MKKGIEKIKKQGKRVFVVMALMLTQAQTLVYAGSIKTSKAATGTEKLLKDATTTLLWLIPVITVIYTLMQIPHLQAAEDAGEAKPIKKKMKLIVVCGVGAFLIDSTFTIILSYYQ